MWPARGRPFEFASESRSVVCVLFGLSEMTSRDARGVVMEKESREARQSARIICFGEGGRVGSTLCMS